MAQKCVHKGCGQSFTDPTSSCTYHPGPPEFHEGQKGWKCCKPRVLTFDEFLEIPPCTTGTHSTVDDTPAPPITKPPSSDAPAVKPISSITNGGPPPAQAAPASASAPPQQPPPPESDSDDPAASVPAGLTCRRRGCEVESPAPDASSCVYHPGQALFHEGTKGWTCCKRRVLEFDEFMRMPGCKTRPTHCFVGKKKRRKAQAAGDGEGEEEEWEKLSSVRHDFYQTPSLIHATYFLKKIDKAASTVTFAQEGRTVELDLKTGDKTRYTASVPLFGRIDAEGSGFRILGTKLDLTLKKAEEGAGWPVLRSDERLTGEIIQTGVAGRA